MRGTAFLASYFRWPLVLRAFIIVIFLMLFFGAAMHIIEPNNFPTLLDGAWWVIVSTATIGYGDFVPKTTIGKLVGILLIFIGTGFVSTYFVNLATAAITRENAYIQGETSYRGKKHMVIIGWNERVRTTISQLSNKEHKEPVVLIDSTLQQAPPEFNNVHFIQGNPTHDETLMKANIKAADVVLITADPNKDELQADTNTILTILAIKGLNPSVYAIAEILTNQQINNAKRAGADEIIESNVLTSYIMTKSISSKGISETLSLMLDHQQVNTLKYIQPELSMIGKTFSECSKLLFQNNWIMIGLKKGDKTLINPIHKTIIEEDDLLIVITNEKKDKR